MNYGMRPKLFILRDRRAMARRRYYFSDRLTRRRRNIRALFTAGLLACAISMSVAASSPPRSSSAVLAEASGVQVCSSPLFATDSCRPPLKSIRHITSDTVADETQRPAGIAAAT